MISKPKVLMSRVDPTKVDLRYGPEISAARSTWAGQGLNRRQLVHPELQVETTPITANIPSHEEFYVDMNPVQNLPKFLLPRLSWTGYTPAAGFASRAYTIPFQPSNGQQWQPPFQPLGKTASRFQCSIPNSRASPFVPLRSSGQRRAFHASAPRRRDHHFDTLKFVQRLQEDGFTEDQAVAMMKVLNDVIEERYLIRPLFIRLASLSSQTY